MDILIEKMREADGIVLGISRLFLEHYGTHENPSWSARAPLHMVENALKGKVGGMVATAGSSIIAASRKTMAAMERWFATHEMLVVHARPCGGRFWAAVQLRRALRGLDEEGKPIWRSVKRDAAAFACARQLGGRFGRTRPSGFPGSPLMRSWLSMSVASRSGGLSAP